MSADNSDDISIILKELSNVSPRLATEGLAVFLDELLRWNPQLGLVSKRDTLEVVTGLITRSVRLWDFVNRVVRRVSNGGVKRVIDIGTGGGFPGIIWRLLDPGLDTMVLIERKRRKIAFLERVIARAGLEGVQAVAADLHEVAGRDTYRCSFELAVMMAVTRPENVASDIERLLVGGGHFCTVRARGESESGGTLGRQLILRASDVTSDGRFELFQRTHSTT